jgi:ABC-2 type transport system permease protein
MTTTSEPIRVRRVSMATTDGPAHRPVAVVAGLAARLTRRGAAVLALSMGTYLAVEVKAFQAAYPDPASRAATARLADNPAIRMLQGVPHAIDTPGGYVAWDAGWLIATIVALWSIFAVTRLLRGEEDDERAALVLSGPVQAQHVVLAQLAVVAGALLVVGAACATALIATGAPAGGSVLFGSACSAIGAAYGTTAALAAQFAGTRRRAIAMVSALLTLGYLTRMIANSTPARGWLRWATPYGWFDETRAYEANRWWVPLMMLTVSLGVAALAVRLRERRDTGTALLAGHARTHSRLGLLGGPTVLAWRLNAPVLAGWLVGLTAYSVMIGALAPAVTQISEQDADYRRVLDQMGMGFAATDRGFIALMGPSLALVVALYACWRIGAARAEEAAGHVDLLLASPVTRRGWLTGHAALTLVGAVLLTLASAAGVEIGVLIVGADVTALDALAAVAAPLPVTVAFTGVALLLFTLVPRLTTSLPAGVVVLAYLLQLLGTALHLPNWVIAISPFDHLGFVPEQPVHVPAMLALLGAGVALGAVAAAIFDRRDLAGA